MTRRRLQSVTPRPGARADELTPKIRALVLEPELDRFTVLWVGTRRLEQPLTPLQIDQVEHAVIWR